MPELKWAERRWKGAGPRAEDRWLCPPGPRGTVAFPEPSEKADTCLHNHLVHRDLATRPSLTPAKRAGVKVGTDSPEGGLRAGPGHMDRPVDGDGHSRQGTQNAEGRDRERKCRVEG